MTRQSWGPQPILELAQVHYFSPGRPHQLAVKTKHIGHSLCQLQPAHTVATLTVESPHLALLHDRQHRFGDIADQRRMGPYVDVIAPGSD